MVSGLVFCLCPTLYANDATHSFCQNHVIDSKVGKVYLLDDYADEKREAWNKLGDRLKAILSTSNVVSLKSA